MVRRRRAPRAGRASLARRSLPRGGPATRPLTLLFTPDVGPFSEALAERQDRFHRPRVNEDGFPDPKRLPSTNSPSVHTDWAYHRSLGFAGLGPASGALSILRMLSHEGSRSSTVVTGYSPEVVRDHAPLVDFCNRNEMRAQPTDPPSPADRAEVALAAAL